MAPGLSGRQTGTVPKKKIKSNGSQSNTYSQLSSLDWELMSDLGSKKFSYAKDSINLEIEGDSVHSSMGRSRSSTTSQNDLEEDHLQNSASNKIKSCDPKQVVSKLSQIQSYLQQTTDLMNAFKSSDSPSVENGDSKRMQKFNRIITEKYRPMICTLNGENNKSEFAEGEPSPRSEESRKKLEFLQKRKQDLLRLQDKAKKQLQEAQAEQSRLMEKASCLNQEISSSKLLDLNVQHLNQRLKAVQQMYQTTDQINESLNGNLKDSFEEGKHLDREDLKDLSDSETNYQLMNDKLDELNAMKAQLGEIQKMMTSISGMQNLDIRQRPNESNDETNERSKHHSQISYVSEGGKGTEDMSNNNMMKLEQAKSKLNHLTQLLDIVQMAQNANGTLPPYLQLVANSVNEEADLSTPSPNASASITSPSKTRDEISIETVQVMTRELEETTAAMKEERDKLEAARQELQNMAKRLPLNISKSEVLSPNDDSESEPPCLKSASLESSFRDILNMSESAETEQLSKSIDNGGINCVNLAKRRSYRNLEQQQNGIWNGPSNNSTQERHCKNESLSRSSNISSRHGSHNMFREAGWSPASSMIYSSERSNPAVQTQNQLEISNNLCEMALSDSGIRQGEISLQGMFGQHQLLTRTVAQCSQLLWMQQKQIIELRNAMMLQNGGLSNFNLQQVYPNQSQLNFPVIGNIPQPGVFHGGFLFPNFNPYLPVSFLPVQNQLVNNEKPNARNSVSVNHDSYSEDINNQSQRIQHHQPRPQELYDQQQITTNYSIPDHLDHDPRAFNRLNLPLSNQNQNVSVVSAHNIMNGRVPNGLNCPNVTEEAGALNNQVPPGNRANNYWDNFRSYSRQNLLSNSKSNEGTESSRRTFSNGAIDRSPRDLFQNNQSGSVASQQQHQQTVVGTHHGNLDPSLSDQLFLPSNLNSHPHVPRNRPNESLGLRNASKNESRNQENDAKLLSSASKNEEGINGICSVSGSGGNNSGGGARSRLAQSDGVTENIRSVRNDMGAGLRSDNLTNSRNCNQTQRDQSNDSIPTNSNKKKSERNRGRKEGFGNLNNRASYSTSLWENISSEVSSFIRTNESRPHFLIQLFRDLQQVTTDNLRQRTLELIQETLTTNNLTERPNYNGGNVNLIENRNNNSNNNVRESRSNLNRNQADDPRRIDDLFCQLRENQNTIRQNIGISSLMSGGNNLENPNISNIRDLVNSRNNLENEGLRDLRTYFEANLCNFGDHHSTLENPNLSNIRENLTRRIPDSDYDNMNPKNVYLSIYDNASVELRRRNLEHVSLGGDNDLDQYRNFEIDDAYQRSEYLLDNNTSRNSNNQFDLKSFEEASNEQNHFVLENGRESSSRFSIFDGGDNFGNPRQFLPNVNDSGIDINFNNEERKRSFMENEGERNVGKGKVKENEDASGSAIGSSSLPQWQRNSARDNSLESSSFIPISDNSFFNCRSFQEVDNGDLAEADQSRNDETSGAESDGGFILTQIIEPETEYPPGQSHHSSESNFSGQNIPESERNFQSEFLENVALAEAACGTDEAAGFSNPAAEPEGNFLRDEPLEKIGKNEMSENFYYFQLNTACSFDSSNLKTVTKYRKNGEEDEKESSEMLRGTNKNSVCGKNVESSIKKSNGASGGECEKSNGAAGPSVVFGEELSHPAVLMGNDRKRTESRELVYLDLVPFSEDKNAKGDKRNTSPEEDSNWECGSGLDQVPTKLKKSGSSRKSDDSGGSLF